MEKRPIDVEAIVVSPSRFNSLMSNVEADEDDVEGAQLEVEEGEITGEPGRPTQDTRVVPAAKKTCFIVESKSTN